MVLVFLSLTFLIIQVQSQIYGPATRFPSSYTIDPGPVQNVDINVIETQTNGIIPPNIPYGSYQPIGPYQPLNNIPNYLPNQLPCPCPINQPILNNPPILNNLPILNNQIPSCSLPQITPVVTNPQPVVPVVATTVIDNSLANSLANTIQLLIVSNLIENTLGSSTGLGNTLAQSLGFLDGPCINNYEVVTPDFTPAITCEYPIIDYTPCNEVLYYQEPVLYQPPCIDITPPCNPNFAANFGPSMTICDASNNLKFDSCLNQPCCGLETCMNLCNSAPVKQTFGCVEPVICSTPPMALEVPFPASIPAQLVCNFGYSPTNAPCVNVNVEPLPFNGCQNRFSAF